MSVSENTSREIFHLSCDVTEKYLKQKGNNCFANNDDGESSDGEAYYVPGTLSLTGNQNHKS